MPAQQHRDALTAALADGGTTIGTWYGVRCPLTAERFGAIGFDWVIADLQHGSLDWSGLVPVLQALQLGGTGALVRVPSHDPADIGRALDLGAIGVVVPMVSSPDQARAVAAAMRFPPRGSRSFGAIRRTLGADLLRHEPFCIVMVETAEGLDQIEFIAAIEGVDCVLLGPTDLAISLGLSDAEVHAPFHAPAIVAAIERLVDACRRAGIVGGAAAATIEEADELVGRGIRLLTIGSAAGFMMEGAGRIVEAARARGPGAGPVGIRQTGDVA